MELSIKMPEKETLATIPELLDNYLPPLKLLASNLSKSEIIGVPKK